VLSDPRLSRVSGVPDTHALSGMPASAETCASNELPGPPVERSDAVTLEAVYEEHFSFVWRSLRALGVDPGLLDDAVQEVFLVVHRRGENFEGRSSLRTWLFGIAFRVACNFRRTSRRRPAEPLSGELTSDYPSPEQHAERAETARFVETFLNGIDEDERAAFTACLLEGLSAPEAAEALGVNANTLYSRVRSVRARFAAALARREKKR
jgi:RNA polymerase sigma-70 factor, ECF subfamily